MSSSANARWSSGEAKRTTVSSVSVGNWRPPAAAARSRNRTDRSDRAAGGGEEGAAGKAIADGARVSAHDAGRTQSVGADDNERCRGLEEVFDTVTAAALADELEELRVLEGSNVVADALAGETESPRDTSGGFGLA